MKAQISGIDKGAHLASATVPWHWLFFCLAPKVRAYFGCPVTKILDSPKWHWLIFAPMGALAYFIICINKCCVLSSLALQLPTYQHHTYIYVNLYMMIPNDSDLFPNRTDEEVPI